MHEISQRWEWYKLSVKGRITIAQTFLLPQFLYLASVLDPNDKNVKTNRCVHNYLNTGSTKNQGNKTRIEYT